ncbi:PIG-L family deacetylase [Enteractinococcus fodinae]|uniref:LmbE family N-acetylglucosaminyl deacetylase n=1 Tax=Enteractinococcus fodinae TaxID=684663 RepID=A0ABU2B0A5_9MICC|nr:PIG-L deacetylase family protein [Enteractinococcus fodinae]MDR7346711.1 LmbE family N-acetylglucosaminyl deacetylase [Enteractinococcus fodinae]
MLTKPVFAADLVSTSNIRRALAIAAHPDDIDFGAGATIAALTDAGVEVTFCLVTSGDAGGFELDQTREQMVARRQQEQRDAARELGVDQVCFLDHSDGYVEPTHRLISQLVGVMRQVQPEVVISQHPQRNWERIQASHPDHLAVGEATARAIYPAVENPFAYPELELPAFHIGQLWMMGAPTELANLAVDVTDHVERKLSALHRHVSQHPDPKVMDDRVRAALAANHPEVDRAAERFHVVAVNDETTFAGF